MHNMVRICSGNSLGAAAALAVGKIMEGRQRQDDRDNLWHPALSYLRVRR